MATTAFKATMHDLLSTYRLQAATTEDFKAIVEKHMSPAMDVQGNHRMDWFFDEYVYGTQLPTITSKARSRRTATHAMLHIKLTQSGVTPTFRMIVPLYLELADGKVGRWVSASITGSSTLDQTVPLAQNAGARQARSSSITTYDVLSIDN